MATCCLCFVKIDVASKRKNVSLPEISTTTTVSSVINTEVSTSGASSSTTAVVPTNVTSIEVTNITTSTTPPPPNSTDTAKPKNISSSVQLRTIAPPLNYYCSCDLMVKHLF